MCGQCKYLWRYEEKNGLEDVFKAQWYVNRLIQELEAKQAENLKAQTLGTKAKEYMYNYPVDPAITELQNNT